MTRRLHGRRVRLALRSCLLGVALLATACSSAPRGVEVDAANTAPPDTGSVAPVEFEVIGERGGPTIPSTTIASTTLPTTTVAPASGAVAPPVASTIASTVPADIAPAVPITPSSASAAPPPVTQPLPRARPTAAPTPPPTATTAPRPRGTNPVPATPATVATTGAPTPVDTPPPTLAPAVASPSTDAVSTTRPRLALAVTGALCRQNQLREERRTKDGTTVRCTRVGTRRRWTVVPATTVAPTIVAQPGTAPGFDGTTIRVGLLTTTTHPVWGTIGRAISAGI